jgi:hypothetical protein
VVEPDHVEIALSSHQNAQLESDTIKKTSQLALGYYGLQMQAELCDF